MKKPGKKFNRLTSNIPPLLLLLATAGFWLGGCSYFHPTPGEITASLQDMATEIASTADGDTALALLAYKTQLTALKHALFRYNLLWTLAVSAIILLAIIGNLLLQLKWLGTRSGKNREPGSRDHTSPRA